MKVEMKESNVSVSLDNLLIGEMGKILSGGIVGHIILRTYEGYVDLSNPEHTWSGNPDIKVERKEFKLVEL